MRVLVCGGRDFSDQLFLFKILDQLKMGPKDTIIHGGAFGADALAGKWARDRKVNEVVFAADWKKYGKSAGPIRNIEMAENGEPDVVIAFQGGKGTAHMVLTAQKLGIKVFLAVIEDTKAL